MSIWLGLSISCEHNVIQSVLERCYVDCEVGVSMDYPDESWPTILAIVSSNPSEFPTTLDLVTVPFDHEESLRIAQFFSRELRCRTICDGSEAGDDDSPYWSIIVGGDQLYLADDMKTDFGDGEGKYVRIIRRLK